MKKFISCIILILVMNVFVFAQGKNYKVVFDMTSRDTINQQSLIREIGLIKDEDPEAQLEVVLYGQGLDLIIKDRSTLQPAVQQLIAANKATFEVCEMTMKRNHIDPSQLLPGVKTVPDGIYEIITKQKEGWGYIKVAH